MWRRRCWPLPLHRSPDSPLGSVEPCGLTEGIIQLLDPTCPCGRREHGVPASSLSAAVTREKGKAVSWDVVITRGMRRSTSLYPATALLTMEGPHRCCLLLLLLCLLPPLGIPSPPLPLEEPQDLPLTLSSTADPTAHLLRGHPSAPVRPYSLSLSPEDYHYSPKPRHLRPGRLRRLLGSAFDPFWMATKEPRGRNSSILEENLESMSRDLAEGAGRYRRKLWREVEGLELPNLLLPGPGLPPELPGALARHLRQWLVELAACRLTSTWVDLGPVFWPRWVRHTACDTRLPGCSWPPGMICRPTQLTRIKLLAWHCWVPQHPGPPNCTWRQIPYPVVTACKCSCR
ncbi:noggin-like [Pseudopipra pipra]|uniref:noggin-like n=1 Tax=Pseudopipra pipra TaxID=415032 RepID=UPI003138F885